MPEYTENDRRVIEAESNMWAIATMLDNTPKCGVWSKRIVELRDKVLELARELRDYNDQWVVDE
jgi:hypothetical protein